MGAFGACPLYPEPLLVTRSPRRPVIGRPPDPGPEALAELREAARLQLLEPIRFHDVRERALRLEFDLPRYGVSLVEVRWWP